jgi:hypothetical protein
MRPGLACARAVAILCVLRLLFWHVCILCDGQQTKRCEANETMEGTLAAWLTEGNVRHFVNVADDDADSIVVAASEAPELLRSEVCIQCARTGDLIHNVLRKSKDRSLIFEPVAGFGRYHIYPDCKANVPAAEPRWVERVARRPSSHLSTEASLHTETRQQAALGPPWPPPILVEGTLARELSTTVGFRMGPMPLLVSAGPERARLHVTQADAHADAIRVLVRWRLPRRGPGWVRSDYGVWSVSAWRRQRSFQHGHKLYVYRAACGTRAPRWATASTCCTTLRLRHRGRLTTSRELGATRGLIWASTLTS